MSDDLILRTAALKVVSDRTRKAYDEARAQLAEHMVPGDRRMAYSPIDKTKLGAVSMSDPEPKARVADRAAFTAWAESTYPDDVEFDFEIIGTHEQVAAVLYEHAPELLKRVGKVAPRLLKLVLETSEHFENPAGPNGELDVPGVVVETAESRVSCLPAPGALAAVVELFRTERMPLELLGGDAG